MDIPTLQAELSRIHWMQCEAEKSLGEQSSMQDVVMYYRLMKTLLSGFQKQIQELYDDYTVFLGDVLIDMRYLEAEIGDAMPKEED